MTSYDLNRPTEVGRTNEHFVKGRFGHWSFRYLVDRTALFFDQRLNPDDPWISRRAIDMLSSALRETDVALEVGAGRSTRWFAERVHHLTSIESDPEWYSKVARDIDSLGNVNLRLFENPRDYVQALVEQEDCHFDFILIDGISRGECALAALPKLKPGGLIAIDNIERYLPSSSYSPQARQQGDGPASEMWEEFADRTSNWRRFWSSNGVFDTCIWVASG